MSNTAAALATVYPEAEIAKFQTERMLNLLRKVTTKTGLNEDQLLEILERGQLAGDFERLLHHTSAALSGIYTVPTRKDESVDELILRGSFTHTSVHVRIPTEGFEDSVAHVKKVGLNRSLTCKELVKEFPRLVHPLVALNFAAYHPEVQRTESLITFWQNYEGEYCFVFLSGNKTDRDLGVTRYPADSRPPENYRLLVYC